MHVGGIILILIYKCFTVADENYASEKIGSVDKLAYIWFNSCKSLCVRMSI